MTDNTADRVFKSLGCIYSEENGAWMYSRLGMGFTTQIEDEMAEKILELIEAERREARIDELERACKSYLEYVPDFLGDYKERIAELKAHLTKEEGNK